MQPELMLSHSNNRSNTDRVVWPLCLQYATIPMWPIALIIYP